MIPNIIDIEASGFGYSSFPIEVGIALSSGEKYCSLIKPDQEWCHWCPDAEKTHQIPRELLQSNGKSIVEVANELNELLDSKTVYSDCWVIDKPWLNKLFLTAGITPLFSISSLEFILTELQLENWLTTKDHVIEEFGLTRHRASNDAMIIQETYRRTRLEQQSRKDF